jgi:hypothetical protein
MLHGIERSRLLRVVDLMPILNLFNFLFIAGLIIIVLLTYKIVASCILGLEVLQNNMHERNKMFKETRMYLLIIRVTKTRRNLFRW